MRGRTADQRTLAPLSGLAAGDRACRTQRPICKFHGCGSEQDGTEEPAAAQRQRRPPAPQAAAWQRQHGIQRWCTVSQPWRLEAAACGSCAGGGGWKAAAPRSSSRRNSNKIKGSGSRGSRDDPGSRAAGGPLQQAAWCRPVRVAAQHDQVSELRGQTGSCMVPLQCGAFPQCSEHMSCTSPASRCRAAPPPHNCCPTWCACC